MIEQSLVRVKAAVVLAGFAVATEAIPAMTVRVEIISSRADVNTVVFLHVMGKFVFRVKFKSFKISVVIVTQLPI